MPTTEGSLRTMLEKVMSKVLISVVEKRMVSIWDFLEIDFGASFLYSVSKSRIYKNGI
jgi:hypothetical protein